MPNFERIANEADQRLAAGERRLQAIGGSYECKIMGSDSVRNGVLIATDRRAILYAKKLFGGFDFEEIPYATVSSIEVSKSLMGYSVKIFASGNKLSMKWIHWGDAEGFTRVVRDHIGKRSAPVPVALQPDRSEPLDLADQIRRLAALRDDGILTEDEFQAKKRQLLGV